MNEKTKKTKESAESVVKLTADTITDEQIEDLRSTAFRDGKLIDRVLHAQCIAALIENDAFGRSMRARCAEILNACNEVKS